MSKGIKYSLDAHALEIMAQYRENLPVFRKMEEVAGTALKDGLKSLGIYVNAIETRIKTEDSLAGKLERKGVKYASINDLTDILGEVYVKLDPDDPKYYDGNTYTRDITITGNKEAGYHGE